MQLVSRQPVAKRGTRSEARPTALPTPAGFRSVANRQLQQIDRQLGYCGARRFVFFYYEPRGQEVIWNDGRSYGFGFGGWQAFGQEVAPVAASSGVDLTGADPRGGQVLVLDRALGMAWFADRDPARRFVEEQTAA